MVFILKFFTTYLQLINVFVVSQGSLIKDYFDKLDAVTSFTKNGSYVGNYQNNTPSQRILCVL